MNEKAINSIREAITNWKGKRNFPARERIPSRSYIIFSKLKNTK